MEYVSSLLLLARADADSWDQSELPQSTTDVYSYTKSSSTIQASFLWVRLHN